MTQSIEKNSLYSRAALFFLFAWLFTLGVFAQYAIKASLSFGWDFDLWFSMGQIMKYGYPDAIYVNGSEISPPYVYSPFATPFFWPLALLPHEVSKLVFGIIRMVLFAIWPAQIMLTFAYCFNWMKSDRRFLLAVVLPCICVLPAIYEDMIVGNVNIFITSGLLYALNLCLASRLSLSAFVISGIIVFKPQYTLFLIPIFLRSPLATVRGGVSAAALLCMLSLMFFTPGQLVSLTGNWLTLIQAPLTGWQDVNNMSVQMLLQRWLSEGVLTQTTLLKNVNFAAFEPELINEFIAVFKLSLVILMFSALLSSFFDRRFHENHQQALFRDFSIICLAVMLLSPLVWQTHLIALVLPVSYTVYLVTHRTQNLKAGDSHLLLGFWSASQCWYLLILLLFTFSTYASGSLFNSQDYLREIFRANSGSLVVAIVLFLSLTVPLSIKLWLQIFSFAKLSKEGRKLFKPKGVERVG